MRFTRICLFSLIIITFSRKDVVAQELPLYVRTIMNNIEGEFEWKIVRPSDGKILRTGKKFSNYELDSLLLLTHETFDDSDILHIAMFGYNPIDQLFFTVGAYNVDMGPHINRGTWDGSNNRVVFDSNDSSRLYLNFMDTDQYFWTYENLQQGSWVKRDLEIYFKRTQDN